MRLEQKRIKSAWARYARRSTAKTFSAKTDHLGMISFARVSSATLFSAKVNHLIKCAFYTNTPLKRPKQETVRIFVINCMPCCNFSVNIGFLAAHEDRNTVKLQSRFSPIRPWPRWTTFVPNGSTNKTESLHTAASDGAGSHPMSLHLGLSKLSRMDLQ